MEKLIKQKLIERGFKEETLLNNRGLTGACIEETEQQLRLYGVVKSLPTKEEIISEGEKQIIDWLEGSTEREKKHYRIGFRRSFEYVLRRIK